MKELWVLLLVEGLLGAEVVFQSETEFTGVVLIDVVSSEVQKLMLTTSH